MQERVTVIGGGHGLAAVLAALRHEPCELTVVVTIAVLMIVRWAVLGAGFFWPAFPLFWLTVSLFVHARVRSFRKVVPY